jgi:hypothetical protein
VHRLYSAGIFALPVFHNPPICLPFIVIYLHCLLYYNPSSFLRAYLYVLWNEMESGTQNKNPYRALEKFFSMV